MLEQIPMTQIPRECECLCGRVCYLARAEGAIGSGRRREYLNLRDGRWNARHRDAMRIALLYVSVTVCESCAVCRWRPTAARTDVIAS